MRRVALKGLWLRRGRATLTALAVVLGVAMVSGTYVLTDTISKAFDEIFRGSYANTSAVVTPRKVVDFASSGAPTVPESLLDRVRTAPGVEEAAGGLTENQGSADTVAIVGDDGKPLGSPNAPKIGIGIDPGATRFNPLSLTEGGWAGGPDEVVIDKGTADDEKIEVGDTVKVAGRGPAEPFRVTGIARYGTLNSLGGATIAVFDLDTAQRLLDKDGFDTIFVAAKPGVTPKELVAQLKPIVGDDAQVRTGEQKASADASDINEALSFIEYFLLAFGIIALGVGAFVIANTLSITISQRTRELATLRALGASARQVRRSVVLEALATGVIASVVGMFSGLLLARGLSAIFKAFEIDLPQSSQVLEPRTIIVSLLLGIGVTLLASLAPARRAMKIQPVAAMQEMGAALVEPPPRRQAVAKALLVVALAALGVGAFAGLEVGTAMLALGVGCLLLFVAVALLARRVVRPLAGFVGAPARRFGSAGRLASRNSTRNPARTASTAAALMIGLALVTLVATLGQGLRSSDRKAIEDTVQADYVVTSENGFDTISSEVGDAVAGAPGVDTVYPVRHDTAKAFGKSMGIDGLPPGYQAVLRIRVDGPRELGRGEAMVESKYADKHDLAVGDTFTVTTAAGKPVELTVAALQRRKPIETLDPVLARVMVSRETFDADFPQATDQYVFVRAPRTAATERAIEDVVARFPSVEAQPRDAWVTKRVEGINTLLNLLYVLLALSVIVSLFGMVNTLVLSVFERTREIGMLRAVGMSRRQVRRMVRHESIITALIGASLGLPLGLVLAALMSSALADQGVAFAVPIGSLVVFTIVAVVAGVLAAIAPARRAARLDVLTALHYE